MGDRFSAFTVAEGKSLATELGFLARSVVVDNLTASWLDMRGSAGRFVPPFTYGATFPLAGGVQVAQASFATPPGITPPTPAGGTANLTFTSAELTPSNGQPVVIPSQQILCPIATVNSLIGNASAVVGGKTITFTNGTGTANVVFTLPAGANSIMLMGGKANGTQPTFSQLFVIGVQSSTLYFSSQNQSGFPAGTLNGANGQFWPVTVVVSSTGDNQIQVNLTANDNSTIVVELTASFGVQAVDISGTPNVNIAGFGGTLVAPASTLGAIPSIPAGCTVAPVQASIANGASAHIIAGVVGRTINLVSATLINKDTGAGTDTQWQDTSGVVFAAASFTSGAGSTAPANPAYFEWGGFQLVQGRGLDLANVSGAGTAVMRGSVTYYFNP